MSLRYMTIMLVTMTVNTSAIAVANPFDSFKVSFTESNFDSVWRGDVDNDGKITIADVTELIDIILGNSQAGEAADVDADGHVSIADVTTLIDIILNNEANKTLKVLFIGNSFSLNTASYVLHILKDITPSIDVTLGILYQGSSSLQNQWTKLTSSVSGTGSNGKGHFYQYYYEGNTNDCVCVWSETSSQNPDSILIPDKQWDIVVLHQRSHESGDYRTFEPYFSNIISYVKDTSRLPNAKIGWLITQAFSDSYAANNPKLDSNGATYNTSEGMYEAIIDASNQVINANGLDFIIPTGTAIQMLRNTEYGEPTRDGYHLSPGIPMLAAGYCLAISILNELSIGNIDKKILSCGYIPAVNESLLSDTSYYDSTRVTTANINLAKQCALSAFNSYLIR